MGVDVEMRVKLPAPISDADLVDASYRLAEAVRYKPFWLSDDEELTKGTIRRALNRVDLGDYFIPEDEDRSLWLAISTLHRYYGVGYERGDIWTWIAVAEWLERNLNGEVFYGGDSGEGVEPFTRDTREALIQHWASVGHRPYFQDGWSRQPPVEAPICPLCQHKATQYGSGERFASWTCDACGRMWEWSGDKVERREK